jgi:hypothetical protein
MRQPSSCYIASQASAAAAASKTQPKCRPPIAQKFAAAAEPWIVLAMTKARSRWRYPNRRAAATRYAALQS